MECLYIPELDVGSQLILVDNEEFKHIKALRLKEGDFISATNGAGLFAEMELMQITKQNVSFQVCKKYFNQGELKYQLGLALGILSDRARFEFALEKAVELGITDFYPLITDFCEKKTINLERMESKAIAAMKQSKRSVLTSIHQPIKLNNNSELLDKYENIILADIDGIHPEKIELSGNTLVLVGPEGGFSKTELEFINEDFKAEKITLGNRRLRAETAVVSALSVISIKLI